MMSELLHVVASTKYPLEAFIFVQRGLDFTVRGTHGEQEDQGEEPATRHVSGQQLCNGLREFAVKQYGLLARTVLQRWQITSCEDFGHIVFAMVDGGLMHKSDGDTLRDFRGVFDFADAFSPQLSLS